VNGGVAKRYGALIYYGLPPIPVSLEVCNSQQVYSLTGELMPWILRLLPVFLANKIYTWVARRKQIKGETFMMARTTRLLYLGTIWNDSYRLGMNAGRLHVYMEYYLTRENVGKRVGALVCETPLVHRRVEGALVIASAESTKIDDSWGNVSFFKDFIGYLLNLISIE